MRLTADQVSRGIRNERHPIVLRWSDVNSGHAVNHSENQEKEPISALK